MTDRDAEWLRWMDGDLDSEATARFEKTLGPEAIAARDSWKNARAALSDAMRPAPLEFPDFLNARILETIERDRSARQPRLIRNLIFGGFGALAAASLLTLLLLPEAFRPRSELEFISQVISARASNPRVSVSTFKSPDRGVVVWVEGADAIPSEEEVQ